MTVKSKPLDQKPTSIKYAKNQPAGLQYSTNVKTFSVEADKIMSAYRSSIRVTGIYTINDITEISVSNPESGNVALFQRYENTSGGSYLSFMPSPGTDHKYPQLQGWTIRIYL